MSLALISTNYLVPDLLRPNVSWFLSSTLGIDFVPCRSLALYLFLDEFHQGLICALQKYPYLDQSAPG
jgi:hypothetical protein